MRLWIRLLFGEKRPGIECNMFFSLFSRSRSKSFWTPTFFTSRVLKSAFRRSKMKFLWFLGVFQVYLMRRSSTTSRKQSIFFWIFLFSSSFKGNESLKLLFLLFPFFYYRYLMHFIENNVEILLYMGNSRMYEICVRELWRCSRSSRMEICLETS